MLLVVVVLPMASRLGAQVRGGTITATLPAGGDTLRTVTPTFLLQAFNIGPARPLTFRFQLDTTPRIGTRVVIFDTTLTVTDSTITLAPRRALPENARIYWRATVRDQTGEEIATAINGPRAVPSWISVVAPSGFSGVTVNTRTPRFVWRSPTVLEPPGPWIYTLTIENFGQRVRSVELRDTVFQLPADAALEANASYGWTVAARLAGTGQATVVSPGTFVVIDSTVALATVLYPSFPNPFPSAVARSTCIWLDLGRQSRVDLEILSARGFRVRRLLPNPTLGEQLGSNRYGRSPSGSGCDPNFEWDGTDDLGQPVPAGLYFVRFRGDGVESLRKVLFRGAR
jgi:hypothetical protein